MQSGLEYSTPQNFRIEAKSVVDAESQLESALEFAPETIVISFSNRTDAVEFYERYRDWRTNQTTIDAMVGAVWTRTDSLFSIGRSGNSVMITIARYSDGWLAYVDTKPYIRCFVDASYSQRLVELRQLWIDRISGTDADKVEAIRTFIGGYADYDRTEHSAMHNNGYHVVDPVAHSMRGFAERRRCVCDGYVAAMQFALACHGIKSFDIIMQSDSGNHAVNKVRLDGEWQTIDALNVPYDNGYSILSWVEDIYGGY